MLDLRRGLVGNHVYLTNPFGRRNDDGDHDRSKSNAIYCAPLTQSRTSQNFEKYDDPCGRMIEFNVDMEDESNIMSPRLWETSSPPTEGTALLHHPHHRPYNHQYEILSPTSRTEAIVRGRKQLMEMVKNMPENSYELSLKDIVEQQPSTTMTTTTTVIEKIESNENTTIRSTKRKNKKKNDKKKEMTRIRSMDDSGTFLLKMFIPTFGLKKKKTTSSKMGTCSKVSPKPPLIGGEKGGSLDKDLLKKSFLVAGESKKSSDSSNSNSSGELLPSCWSFFNTKKSKSMG